MFYNWCKMICCFLFSLRSSYFRILNENEISRFLLIHFKIMFNSYWSTSRGVPRWKILGGGRWFFEKFWKILRNYRNFQKIFRKFFEILKNFRKFFRNFEKFSKIFDQKKQNFWTLGGVTPPTLPPARDTPVNINKN